MKSVVVKKNKAHRTAIRWLFLAGWFATGVMGAFLRDLGVGILLCLPGGLILSPLYIYYESWSLTFSQEGIQRIQWGQRRYSWNDIREVMASRSTAEGEDIRVFFRDGKMFRFRRFDENAEKAVKMIQSHRSIVWK